MKIKSSAGSPHGYIYMATLVQLSFFQKFARVAVTEACSQLEDFLVLKPACKKTKEKHRLHVYFKFHCLRRTMRSLDQA